jgi:hypothetical protein
MTAILKGARTKDDGRVKKEKKGSVDPQFTLSDAEKMPKSSARSSSLLRHREGKLRQLLFRTFYRRTPHQDRQKVKRGKRQFDQRGVFIRYSYGSGVLSLVQIQEHSDKFKYIWLFDVEHMRNSFLQEVRTAWKPSRFVRRFFFSTSNPVLSYPPRIFLGRNAVMRKALGSSVEEEYRGGCHLITKARLHS